MAHHTTDLLLIFDLNLLVLVAKSYTKEYSQEHHLEKSDIIDGIIFNSTKIMKLIDNFIRLNNLDNLSATIIVHDTFIIQTLHQDLELDPKTYCLKSYELQFYPHPILYHFGIKHYQILQYALLCAKLSIELKSIIPSMLHLYSLFKAISYKPIHTSINTVESLKTFLSSAINESRSPQSICNLKNYFDTFQP